MAVSKMLSFLKEKSKSTLIKNLSIVFSESIITRSLSFAIILFLARELGPEEYGKYSFIFIVVTFCSSFFDFGMENTAVRFLARNKEKKNSIFGLYFLAKAVITIVTLLCLGIFGKYIFAAMHKESIVQYMMFLIMGLVGESLFFINDTYLQAVQRFKLRASINISRYAIVLAFIVILYFKKLMLLKFVFCMYIIVLIFCLTFVPTYISFIRGYLKTKMNSSLVKEIFSYQKWMFVLSIATNTLGRIDFFMLSLWVSYSDLGIYNAANQLSTIVSFIPLALGKVLLPKVAEMKPDEVFSFTYKTFKPLIISCTCLLITIPVVKPLVPFFLGSKYVPSIPIFQVFLLISIICIMLMVVEISLYSLGKPQVVTYGKYYQIGINIILNILTIPRFGMIWAAINLTIARIIYGIVLIVLFFKYRKASLLKAQMEVSSNEEAR